MTTQTIRDVILRVSIQSNNKDWKPPDLAQLEKQSQAAIKSIEGVTKALSGATAELSKQSKQETEAEKKRRDEREQRREDERERKRLEREAAQAQRDRERDEERQRKDREKEERREQQEAEKRRQLADQAEQLRSDKIVERQLRSTKYQRDADKSRIEISTKMLDLDNQRADAMNAGATAALKLARGLAFLTASTSEDYQVMLKWIATIQGISDVGTGVLDFYKTWIALKKVSIAQTSLEATAELSLAAARSKSAAAGGGALGAGLSSGIGTATGAAAGGAAVRGGLSTFGGLLSGAASRVALPLGLAYAGGAVARGYIDEYTQGQMQRMGPVGGLQYAEGSEGQAALRREGMARISRQIAQQTGGPDRDVRFSSFERGEISADEFIKQEEERIKNLDTIFFKMQRVGVGISKELEDTMKLAAFSEEQAASYEKRIKSLEREEQVMREQVANAERLKEVTLATLQAEEQRYQSLEERVGRLDPQAFARLSDIAKKQRSGQTLSLQEAGFLESTGIGSAQAAARFRQEGQARGASGILEAFGENRGIDQARKAFRDVMNIQDQGAKELREQIDQSEKRQRELFMMLGKAIGTTFATNESVRVMQEAANQAAAQARNSAVQNRGVTWGEWFGF